jgi:rod shape-determining protein MreC
VPRNRTARLAVLASVAQRSATAPYSSRATSALRRRAAAAALVIVSLALITVYFRESNGGSLHGIQSAAATVLKPFEVAANRIASPFRDAYGYFSDLADAKSEADRLRKENALLRQERIGYALAIQQNDDFKRALKFKGRPTFPRGYKLVATEVLAQPPNQFDRQISIGAGVNDGVHKNDPVVSPEGFLVGTVSLAFSHVSRVTLLTDETSAVAAIDQRTAARGVVRASGDTLILDRVSRAERVHNFDLIITSGFKWGDLSSLYPKGIEIGTVSSTSQVDTDLFKRVQITPSADFSSLENVLVVTTSERR